MILPHDKQLGAVSNKGCIEALHAHCRLSEDSDGLVLSSSAAIAEVRSLMLDMAVGFCGLEEPELCTACLKLLDFTFGRSDIREPEADGGSFDGGIGLRSLELVSGIAI